MRVADISQSLEFVKNLLSDCLQSDLVLSSDRLVSWRGYKCGIFKDQYYPVEYQWLIDHHQYSYLLRDGSFFQFYYEFGRDGLNKARAAFYPRPISSNCKKEDIYGVAEACLDANDESLSEYLLNIVEEIERTGIVPPNTSHVRFDFDKEVTSHEVSHLQFGGIGNLRIPSDFFPTPLAFVEFISDLITDCNMSFQPSARSHSVNKALRNLVCNRVIGLKHD
ncbi:DUF2290 domain-containing protein [Thiothrix subterranea]|uniref:DUF2290 domain-containing protein n=1 Tax=Thiothrix subterranea TaxID=2735563 RepID=A0AA51R3M5_9GAMM|nr:DUF2290 domain-containing protein [Thiothrix subterranea]MDQ5769628.1 DUF2290 domain-containing protein [Thiothrix subterranea]WML85700.1 DUF2290 domain-containing protein [Thiothrix subterranea]